MAASQKWLVDIKKQRKDETEEANTFWLNIRTFLEKFFSTTICHCLPDYSYCHFADTHSSGGHGVSRVIVPFDISTKVIFTLHQTHRRFLDGWISGTYEYAPLQLYLARVY